jgi:hypothetical protein
MAAVENLSGVIFCTIYILMSIEILTEMDNAQYLQGCGRIIFKRTLKIGWEDVNLKHLPQDRDQFWAVSGKEMNFESL